MKDTPNHLKTLEEIEQEAMPGLVEVLHKEGLEAVRSALWEMMGWHQGYTSPAWRNRATKEQKKIGWEMTVRIEKILAEVLNEAHKQQTEEVLETFTEGPDR